MELSADNMCMQIGLFFLLLFKQLTQADDHRGKEFCVLSKKCYNTIILNNYLFYYYYKTVLLALWKVRPRE